MSFLNWIFPFSSEWSWGTFILYVIIGIIVTQLCYKGACLNAKSRNTKGNFKINGYYLSAFVILLLLATLRSENVGPDTKVYLKFFHDATSLSFNLKDVITLQQTEIGFLFYLYVLRLFTDSNIIYFLVTYAWIAGVYIFFIKNMFDQKSDYIFLQLFIYYYVLDMSNVRSALGTSFILISLIYLKRNKYFPAIILTIIACTFHYTMIFNFYIIIAVCLFKNKKTLAKRWLWIVGFLSMIVISVAGLPLLQELLKNTKYRSYISFKLSDRSLLGSVFIFSFGILCMLFYRRIIQSEQYNKISVAFISSLALLVMYPLTFVIGAYRIPNYYAMCRLRIWSEMVKIDNERSKLTPPQDFIYKLVIQIIIILYLLFLFTRVAVNGQFQYEFVFYSN